MRLFILVLSLVLLVGANLLGQDTVPAGYQLVFEEDFEDGIERWNVINKESWTHRQVDGNWVFGINRRESEYEPEVRSPRHIALIKSLELSDFIITFKVRSTKDTGNHRDCCVFFNYQDPKHYFYVHLGARPDQVSGQIMVVDGAPRTALTENKNPVPWTDQWHQVKVVRDSKSGLIQVYFDDMNNPVMQATDTRFGPGQIGLGSFDDMNDFDDIAVYEKIE